MSEFSGSLTAQFQSRAGSVYPMMKRLHRENLLKQKKSKRGRQDKTVYSISAAGKNALKDWLAPSLEESNFGLTEDPLRSRIYFLEILPKASRAQFVENALSQLREELRSVNASIDEYRAADNEFGVLAMKGAVYVTRARIRWLAEIRQLV